MVNCLSTEEMYVFIDARENDEKMKQINTHIESCATCSVKFEELLEAEHNISAIFPSVHVEDTFTNQVMERLPQKKTLFTKKRDWRPAFVTVLVTVALLFLVFSSLQQESRTSSPPSVSITVKDVTVTDVSIVVTVATSGYKGNETFYNDSNRNSGENNISLVLPNGKSSPFSFSTAKQSMNEITYEFGLFDVAYEDFKILFDYKHIYDIDGQWSLEVPIDRTELLANTQNVTMYSSFEKDGIDVNFLRAQHGPDNSLFKFETKFSEDMATFIEQQVTKYTVDLPLDEKQYYTGYNAQILYNVIDADGQTLSRSIPEDTISIQNDRYAHTETLSAYPSVQDGGYISVIGAKFELPTNVRHVLTVNQLPYTFTYKDTVYEVKLLPDQRLEISSDAKSTTISSWHITVDHKTAWDTARLRTDQQKQYTTFTFNEGIHLDSFILYGQTESKFVYFDEAVHVDVQ